MVCCFCVYLARCVCNKCIRDIQYLERAVKEAFFAIGSFRLDRRTLGDQALDGHLNKGVVLLHIVSTGRQSLLQHSQINSFIFLRCGNGFDDELAHTRPLFLGLGAFFLVALASAAAGADFVLSCRERYR